MCQEISATNAHSKETRSLSIVTLYRGNTSHLAFQTHRETTKKQCEESNDGVDEIDLFIRGRMMCAIGIRSLIAGEELCNRASFVNVNFDDKIGRDR